MTLATRRKIRNLLHEAALIDLGKSNATRERRHAIVRAACKPGYKKGYFSKGRRWLQRLDISEAKRHARLGQRRAEVIDTVEYAEAY